MSSLVFGQNLTFNVGELYVCNEDRTLMSMTKIKALMEGQGAYANINYPSVRAVKSRGLPVNGVVVEFCTFGDYSDTHKVCRLNLLFLTGSLMSPEQFQF